MGFVHTPDPSAYLRGTWIDSVTRTVSVLTMVLGVLLTMIAVGMMIFNSGVHMKDNWPVYELGAQKVTNETQARF